MPNLHAITRERHAHQQWRRNTRFDFAATDAVAPVVVQELAAAMQHLPIALVARAPGSPGVSDAGGVAGSGATVFQPVVLLGVQAGVNVWVAPDGRWQAGYTPAAYRGYPFVVAKAPDGVQVLCVDEDSGVLCSSGGEAFFGPDGQPSRALTEVFQFLSHVVANRSATDAVCALWHQHGLVVPWPLQVHTGEGRVGVQGLFTLDEARLQQLSAPALAELMQGGALAPAYCLLFSLQHVPALLQRKQAHDVAVADAAALALAGAPVKGRELDLSFLEGSGTFKFT